VKLSLALALTLAKLRRLARTDQEILLVGESGVGKEVLAEVIHAWSPRAAGPLVKVNCAAIPETLLESELFGHEKGSFTGAVAQRIGRFETANGGTIFLDEIADMSKPLQAKLLRFLEDGTFTRVGGTQELRVNVRLIAATNRDITKSIAGGDFREDLFHRLNVVSLRIPGLSERREDIPELAAHLLARVADATGLPSRTIGEDTLAALQGHDWPGNVRQLRNVIERLLILAPADGGPIRADVLPNDVSEDAPSVLRWEKGGEIMQLPLRDAREVFERGWRHERQLFVGVTFQKRKQRLRHHQVADPIWGDD